ncbi:glycosyl transferase group 1 [Sulfobacillus acidophilus TPY]|uniref:Glycosyl transferase group 1 n=1 Tax=Sulfobacillus acidophilus (strain ATCC 700253 / DSM 10332 / NAL) TaxID=679936 RepID=G8TS96_SULAD|nr:glycosyl transferase group 1 [Sulfobacillus acidophilus TPY]AEW05508.1 glycosyl transferase group 1 [Sulfobacillus acidophilus DSM 10332]
MWIPTPEDTVFIVISFEGPDPYSQAGGLGVRVTGLTRALAARGFPVHFFFLGDPDLPPREQSGTLTLYRWGQWISRYHRQGVYSGEWEKRGDMEQSLTPFVTDTIAEPAFQQQKRVVVLAEEWHTASIVIQLSDTWHAQGYRDKALFLWNANHRMGLHHVDFSRLGYVATLTTVSRFMKHLFWNFGIDPVVIPNGLDASAFEPVNPSEVLKVRRVGGAPLLVKVGRFDPDKRWIMALEAMARLKAEGLAPRLLMRGGMEPHGAEVMGRARALGLSVTEITLSGTVDHHMALNTIAEAPAADIVHLRFFLPASILPVLYRAADAVLVNSGFEPFGLVGLEVMAAGGVAITGATGEDYAQPFVNSLVLQRDNPAELAALIRYIGDHPTEVEHWRAEAQQTARSYQWDHVLNQLTFQIGVADRLSGQA